MSYKTALPRDLAETISSMIDELIEKHPEAVKRDIQRDLIQDLHALATAGEAWADRAILALAEDGCGSRIQARLKEDKGTIRISQSGAVISLPTRFGVRARGEGGQVERHFQQPLWWELSWERFHELINSLVRQRDVLSHEIVGLREIERLHERFPDTRTPLEACERAGIDPYQFSLPEDQQTA